METQKIEIIRSREITVYPNGHKLELDYICDVWCKANYPIFKVGNRRRSIYIVASICHECATEMMLQEAT